MMQVFSRTLKMAVYYTFAPIGLCDVMHGSNSNGFRFIKRCFGIGIQGIIMIGILACYSAIAGSVFNLSASGGDVLQFGDLLGRALTVLALLAAVVGLFAQSENIANTLVGG
jgi:hypothetical protein